MAVEEISGESVEEKVTEEITKEQQKMNELMRRLIDANTTLIVKVAACDCRKKNTCKVYLQSQEIAKIIDELQELRR
ncbi:hypothetical protein DRN97_04210 [Methanosarcinales archaeon]|nr:MAG: hypothetical protein DRN97_04210 [Methanosarcinales archaeon]